MFYYFILLVYEERNLDKLELIRANSKLFVRILSMFRSHTANRDIFVQCIFLRISRRALDVAPILDVNKDYYHKGTKRNN